MSSEDDTRTAVERFNSAVNNHDVEAVVAAMTEDVFFESTMPPDGDRHVGADAVGAFFQRLFESSDGRRFDAEEIFVADDRAVVRWRHRWVDQDGKEGHVRGVDVFRVRDGKVSEKLSYVKG